MPLWLTIVLVLAALAVGLPLAIWATAGLRRNKKNFAVASALLFAFGAYNPIEEKIAETRDDADFAKQNRGAGDPPTSD